MSMTLDRWLSLWATLPAGLIWFVLILLGLIVGSFLTMLAWRLPRLIEHEEARYIAALHGEPDPGPSPMNLGWPRSMCASCHRSLALRDNLPLLGWLLQLGRCRWCGKTISIRYPLLELSCAALTCAAWWRFGAHPQWLAALLLIWTLLVLTEIDFETQLLPDELTKPLLWLGLLFNLDGLFVPLADAVLGAVWGYLILWSVYWLYRLIRGLDGLGQGDFKLMAALGAWFGWQSLPSLLLIASLSGVLWGVVQLSSRRIARDTPFAFGPFIALAGVTELFFGWPLVTRLWA